jgi:RNA polymerase sigma-70 factor (ECF subfamily)
MAGLEAVMIIIFGLIHSELVMADIEFFLPLWGNKDTEVAHTAGRAFPASPAAVRRPGQDALDMLLEATARREHGAFNLVYEQLTAPVHAVVRAVLRDPAQAEEVAQEVLLEIWLVAFRYDPAKGHAKAWVLTIARRRAIDRVRSSAAAEARERRAATVPYLDQVSDMVEGIMEREQLRRCLGALSDLQREAIMLTFYDGYTNMQVASLLRVPLGTAKARIRDGLIKLRNVMADGAAAPSRGARRSAVA